MTRWLLLGALLGAAPLAAQHAASAPDSSPRGLRAPRDRVAAATRAYRTTGIARTVTEGSAVTFPFGHAQPAVTCAILRVCVIELQPSEVIESPPIAGDTVRWRITPAQAGPGGHTTLVVVKPTDCDPTTNLVIPTDRRIYDLTLDAPPCKGVSTNPQPVYTREVRFYYPDEAPDAWTHPAAAPPPPPPVALAPSPAALDFRYRVTRDGGFPWTPAQVFDDGTRVYIKLPDAARHDAAPVLYGLGPNGARTLLNYAIAGDVWVTDRLFARAVMVLDDGGTPRTLTIEYTGTRAGGGS